jgi:hypothetical protein
MSAGAHQKGSRWRHLVDEWFTEAGFVTHVRGIGWPGDDLLVLEVDNRTWVAPLRMSVECKNHNQLTVASFVDQAVEQAHDYPELTLPVVVAHRRGRVSVDDAHVILPGWAFIELVTRK